jgi:adenosylhomocysteine nucleosidase
MSTPAVASRLRTRRRHRVHPVRVLVTFALENEFAPWRALRKFRRSTWGGAEVYRAEIGAAEVGVLLTGVGARQATLEMSKRAWSESDSVEFCISSGLAGALRPEYQIGQVLAARTIETERASANAASRVLESSAPLISFAEECGAIVADRFYSAERVVSRAEEKHHLGASADAVEMESFQVLSSARRNGVPGVAIRAISDTADDDLPLDMNEVFTDGGKVSIPRILGQVVLHPRAIPELVKLGQKSKRAAESLAIFLDRYIFEFSERARTLESVSLAGAQQTER